MAAWVARGAVCLSAILCAAACSYERVSLRACAGGSGDCGFNPCLFGDCVAPCSTGDCAAECSDSDCGDRGTCAGAGCGDPATCAGVDCGDAVPCTGGDCGDASPCPGGDCTPRVTCPELVCVYGECRDDGSLARCVCDLGWSGARCDACEVPLTPIPNEPQCAASCGPTLCAGNSRCDTLAPECVCDPDYLSDDGICRAGCALYAPYQASSVDCTACDDSGGKISCVCPSGEQDYDGDFLCEPECGDCGGHGSCAGDPPTCACASGYHDLDGDYVCEPDCSAIDCAPQKGCGVGGVIPEGDPGRGTALCRCVVYADPGATGSNNGSTWANAMTDLASAVTTAASRAYANGAPCEVWLAAGIYDVSEGLIIDTQQSWEGVGLYGGFDGTETHREQRNPALHRAILDGGGVATVPLLSIVNRSLAVIDGLELTGGTAGAIRVDAPYEVYVYDTTIYDNTAEYGAGIWMSVGMLILERVGIFRNQAVYDGGGLYLTDTATENLWFYAYDSAFAANVAGAHGGALAVVHNNADSVWHDLRDTSFVGNRAAYGGAVSTRDVNLELSRTMLASNHASRGGGAVYADAGYVAFYRAIVADNRTDGSGAASYATARSGMRWMEAAFLGNRSFGDGSVDYVEAGGRFEVGNSLYLDDTAALIQSPGTFGFYLWGNLGLVAPVCNITANCNDVIYGFDVATPTFREPASPPTGTIASIEVPGEDWDSIVNSSGAYWRPGALAGALAVLPGETLPIVANGTNWFRVRGTATAQPGSPYTVRSMRPDGSSPVIDRAEIATGSELLDMSRRGPWDDLLVEDLGAGVVPYADVGPYEFIP